MKEGTQDSQARGLKQNGNGEAAAGITCPIATTGEIFANGSLIELIGGSENGDPKLMLWDGANETVGPVVEFEGRRYEAAAINRSVVQALTLPTRSYPHGTTRELLAEVCELVTNFVGLDEKSASLTGRIVLCSAIVDAVSVAPALVIVGPDTARANRLVALLRCLCRHSLPLTGVTPAGFCSLASGARFTFLISQATVSDKLQKMLDDASSRDQKIPFRGGLLDLFGVQVIRSDSCLAGDSWPYRSIQIATIPTGQELPAFDRDVQQRIASEFQAKLLSFRRAVLGAAGKVQFDASRFSFALRHLARSMAAATPDDCELQAEVFELLQEYDAEIRSEKWTASSSVTIEAIVVAGRESPGGAIYVADLAEIAQEILRRRGEMKAEINPAVLGKTLKVLGFATEPRDAKGKKLLLTDALVSRARELARAFGGPEVEDDRQVNTSQQQ